MEKNVSGGGQSRCKGSVVGRAWRVLKTVRIVPRAGAGGLVSSRSHSKVIKRHWQ